MRKLINLMCSKDNTMNDNTSKNYSSKNDANFLLALKEANVSHMFQHLFNHYSENSVISS